MPDWIEKYWIEWIFGILCAVLAFLYRSLASKLKKQKTESDAVDSWESKKNKTHDFGPKLEAGKTYVLKETVSFAESDPKTALQELLQEKNLSAEYILVGESGPEHDKTFEAEVQISGKPYARGTGRSKKAAQMQAALETLRMMKDQKCI